MARSKKTVTENQRRSIVAQDAQGKGLKEIGDGLETSVGVIRRVLADSGVEIRGRGRPCKAVEA